MSNVWLTEEVLWIASPVYTLCAISIRGEQKLRHVWSVSETPECTQVSSCKCFCIIAVSVLRKHENCPIVPSRNSKVLQEQQSAMSVSIPVINKASSKAGLLAVGFYC